MTMKISTRLWLPALVLGGIVLLMSGTVGLRTSSQIALSDALLRDQEAKLQDATNWQGLTTANMVRVVASVISSDAAVEAAMKPEIEATTARIGEIQKRIEAAAVNDEERSALAAIASARQAYIAARDDARKVKAGGDAAAAKAMLTDKVQPAITAYAASQQAYVVLQQAHGVAVRAATGDERMRTVWTVIGVMLAMAVSLGIGTFFLVRSICRPMDELTAIARRIGDGDLDVEIDHQRSDEIGAVQQSLATMRDALRGIVGQVRESAESIQLASAEVASGNTDLSHRTEQAAANLQQTAGSLEQLTGNVRQSADAAAQANQLAASASAVAQRGGQVVSQVVSTMDEINRSSKRIADIIGTIDGIAFQTNILALNAAVEAARAGEQGRGFAVVASEVRSLAQRSAEAAREIKTLIGSSVEKVETGARLVQDAGSTMAEIVASVQRVTDVIGEITAAAAEQSSGIGAVNAAISSLDQMTQQNAALVEQSAAAAESLNDQARRLSQAMGVFRLSVGQALQASPTLPAANAPRTSATPAPAYKPAAAALRATAPPSHNPAAALRPALPSPTASAASAANPASRTRTNHSNSATTSTAVATSDSADWETF